MGWFAVFTTENEVERPILIVSMVEDVKGSFIFTRLMELLFLKRSDTLIKIL